MKTWKVILFGAGQAALNVIDRIEKYVICIADNDKEKQGKKLSGKQIISADQIAGFEFDAILITSIYEKEIKEKLLKMGYGYKIIYYSDSNNPAALKETPEANRFYSDFNKPVLETMHLNLTSACNLHCRICRPPNVKNNMSLSRQRIEGIVDDVFDKITHLRLDSSGELTLSPHLGYVLDEAKKRNISIFISSNGTLIDKKMAELIVSSNVEHIQISLDSSDKETSEWIRMGAKHETILQGTKNLVAAKKKFGKSYPQIDFHGAIMQQNVHHLKDIIHLANDIGINGVSFAYCYINSHMDPKWSIFFDRKLCNEEVLEARECANQYDLTFNAPESFFQSHETKPSEKYCQYLFNWTYVNPNGGVSPCCTAPGYVVGNVETEKISDIWDGEKYQKLRETYNTDNPECNKCSNCYLLTGWDVDDYKVHFHPDHWLEVQKILGG